MLCPEAPAELPAALIPLTAQGRLHRKELPLLSCAGINSFEMSGKGCCLAKRPELVAQRGLTGVAAAGSPLGCASQSLLCLSWLPLNSC